MNSRFVSSKIKINAFVTISHIVVTLSYTASQVILIFNKSLTQNYRMISAFIFFGGLADIFLSIMLWFILYRNKSPALVIDGNRVYPVTEVITGRLSGINEDCEAIDNPADVHDDISRQYSSPDSSFVSRKMIEQFFTEVDGPERDWLE